MPRRTSPGRAHSTRRVAASPPHVGHRPRMEGGRTAVDPETERSAAAPGRRLGRRPHPFARSDVVALGHVFSLGSVGCGRNKGRVEGQFNHFMYLSVGKLILDPNRLNGRPYR